ncbi:hypothetical protein ACFGWM_03345 [Pasteurella multocida]
MLNKLDCFFNEIINPQISKWKTQNICISINYDCLDYIRIGFLGINEEKMLLDINMHNGLLAIPKSQDEFKDGFYLIGNRKIKVRRYTICCESPAQAEQALEYFNKLYGTQFSL